MVDDDPTLCQKCHKDIDADNHERLVCDKCTQSFHLPCTLLPTYEIVKYFKKNLYKRKYVCKSCIEKVHLKDVQRLTPHNPQLIQEEKTENEDLRKKIEEYEEKIECLNTKIQQLQRELEEKKEDDNNEDEDEDEDEDENDNISTHEDAASDIDYEAKLREMITKIIEEKLQQTKTTVEVSTTEEKAKKKKSHPEEKINKTKGGPKETK